jgi:hypothetical protein
MDCLFTIYTLKGRYVLATGLFDNAVLKKYSITKLWFIRQRDKTVVSKKEVMSGVSKTPKRLQF